MDFYAFEMGFRMNRSAINIMRSELKAFCILGDLCLMFINNNWTSVSFKSPFIINCCRLITCGDGR